VTQEQSLLAALLAAALPQWADRLEVRLQPQPQVFTAVPAAHGVLVVFGLQALRAGPALDKVLRDAASVAEGILTGAHPRRVEKEPPAKRCPCRGGTQVALRTTDHDKAAAAAQFLRDAEGIRTRTTKARNSKGHTEWTLHVADNLDPQALRAAVRNFNEEWKACA